MADKILSFRDLRVYRKAFQQKRRYQAYFVGKMTDADGEQAEIQHWLNTAKVCHYLSDELHGKYMKECLDIGRMRGGMINKPESFCK